MSARTWGSGRRNATMVDAAARQPLCDADSRAWRGCAHGQSVHGGHGPEARGVRGCRGALRISLHGRAAPGRQASPAGSAGAFAGHLAHGACPSAATGHGPAGHRWQVHGGAHGQPAGRRTGGGCAGVPGLSVPSGWQAGEDPGRAPGAAAHAHPHPAGRAGYAGVARGRGGLSLIRCDPPGMADRCRP